MVETNVITGSVMTWINEVSYMKEAQAELCFFPHNVYQCEGWMMLFIQPLFLLINSFNALNLSGVCSVSFVTDLSTLMQVFLTFPISWLTVTIVLICNTGDSYYYT